MIPQVVFLVLFFCINSASDVQKHKKLKNVLFVQLVLYFCRAKKRTKQIKTILTQLRQFIVMLICKSY